MVFGTMLAILSSATNYIFDIQRFGSFYDVNIPDDPATTTPATSTLESAQNFNKA